MNKTLNSSRVSQYFLCFAVFLFANSSLGASDIVIDYQINASPMAEALKTYARQTNLQVAFSPQSVKGLQAAAVQGRFTSVQALELLLGNNDLDYQFASDKLVVVRGPNDRELPNNGTPGQSPSLSREQLIAQNQVRAQQEPGNGLPGEKDEEAPGPLELESLVVTGSHIRGLGPVGSQVLSFSRDDIELMGFSSLTQFMQSLPQNFNGGITESTNQFGGAANRALNNFNSGTGVNMRGLGNVSTLVLLNGRRMAPTGTDGSYVDISAIPLSALDRVEVLTDGASATYGSDAIGGVVNFILRKDYDGAETRLRYGQSSEGGLDEVLVGQSIGKTWGEGYGLLSYEYGHRDALHAADRSFSASALSPNDLLPEQERHSLYLSGGYTLPINAELLATAYYSSRDTERFLYSPPFVPVTLSSTDNEQYGGNLGIEFDLGERLGRDWHAELIGSYNRNESVSDSVNLSTGNHQLLSRGSENLSLDATLDGSVFSMPGGDAKLAIGGHFRRDQFFNLPQPAESGSTILPLSEDSSRDVSAIFGELYLPLVGESNRRPGIESLEMSLSGRYEHYSDFDSSTDPKFGVNWSPVSGLDIRGTYGTSYRAPLFTELDEAGNVAFLINSIPNPMSGTSLVILLAGAGNAGLQPETATTWTAGFDLQPASLPNFSLNLTYFSIDYEDRIITPPYTTFSTLLTDPRFASLVFVPDADLFALIAGYTLINLTPFPGFDPPAEFEDTDFVFDGRVANLATNKTTGVDFEISYGLETADSGNWNFSLNGTYLFDYLLKVSDVGASFDAVSTIQNPMDLRLNGSVSWSHNGFTTSLFVQHVGDYLNNVTAVDTPVDSWTTANLTFGYDTRDRHGGWLDNMIFRISAVNLFNEDPPFVQSLRTNSGVNYDPNAANPMGRFLSFQVTKEW